MNKRDQRKALNQLKRHVRELMKQSTAEVLKRIDQAEQMGAGLAEEHATAAGQWVTPKNVICAFSKTLYWMYAPITTGDRRRVKKLEALI